MTESKDIIEVSDQTYDAVRDLEKKLKLPGLKRVRRKKKYVSPRRVAEVTPTEIVCVECKLPSTRGLPPFIAVNRLIDGEIRKTLRHAYCPQDADGILALVIQQRADAKKRRAEFIGPTKGTGSIAATSYVSSR